MYFAGILQCAENFHVKYPQKTTPSIIHRNSPRILQRAQEIIYSNIAAKLLDGTWTFQLKL